MSRKRNKQRHPVIGGVVSEDSTKQGRRRRAKATAAEMTAEMRKRTRKDLKIPTPEETADVLRSKER